MTVITPIRSDNAYFGFSKESTPGTPVAPTVFPRWWDGSSIEINATMEDMWEGDGSWRLSNIVKNKQMVKIKLVAALRPVEMGFFETAGLGSGGDSYAAPTVNTTLSSGSSVGATSISVAANTGLTGSTVIPLVIDAGLATEEIALFAPPVTGPGPYSLPVSNTYNGGNGLRFAHSSGHAVQGAGVHTITDQTDGNYYTIEVGLGSLYSGSGTTLRVRTCKVASIKRSCKAGGILMHEIEFVGIASTVGSAATVTLEQHQPFLMTQGAWTLDSVTTGDALNVEQFSIEQKNQLDDGIQTEQLTLAAIIFGGKRVYDAAFDLVYTSNNKIYQTYFGGTGGTTDAQLLGTGSLTIVFTQADTLQILQFTFLTLGYSKVGLPAPKKDGKHYKLAVSSSSLAAPLSGSGSNNAYMLQTTLNNTQYSAY